MSKFTATVTIKYEIDDYDDEELELDEGLDIDGMTADELRIEREKLVTATYSEADPTSFIIEIGDIRE